ncbi:MAG TPA: hypothetical protein VII74_03235 [Chthoniobacterales bacterium]
MADWTIVGNVISSVSGFLYQISPSLLTLLVGSLILQKFFVSKANEAAFIDNLVGRLDALQADALEYWATDSHPAGEPDTPLRILESRIKGGIKSLASDLAYYTERYGERHEFNRLLAELSDACSAGDFESTARKPDSARYILIVNAISRVRTELLRRKL